METIFKLQNTTYFAVNYAELWDEFYIDPPPYLRLLGVTLALAMG